MRFSSLIAFIFLFGLNSLSAQKTIHVDKTALGSNDGTTWENAFVHLQDALSNAYENDQILIAQGTYYPDEGTGRIDNDRESTFSLASDVAIHGGFPSGGDIFENRDHKSHPTILSGDLDQDEESDNNALHVIFAFGARNVSLDGLIITSGNANIETADEYDDSPKGGGLYCFRSNLSLTNCSFNENQGIYSGGIYVHDSSLSLSGCDLRKNNASYGGGISALSTNLDLQSCSFIDNHATSKGGGAYVDLNSTSTFTRCLFKDNSASTGGGIYKNNSLLAVIESSFLSNRASSFGGAISNKTNITTAIYPYNHLQNCLMKGNSAGLDGGAIDNNGGNFSLYASSLGLNSCVIQGNYAGRNGGGVASISSRIDIAYCSIQGNQAQLGAGVWNSPSNLSYLSISNSIVWENFAIHRNIAFASSVVGADFIKYCLIQGRGITSTNFIDGTDPQNDPRFVHPVDPLKAPTIEGDLRLLSDSPAIGIGLNSTSVTYSDFFGYPRPPGKVDLGAFLFQGVLHVDPHASGGDGTSWSTAFTSLQNALDAASPHMEIQIARGTYFPEIALDPGNPRSMSFQLKESLILRGGYPSGGGIRNSELNPTILSGDLMRNDHTEEDISDNAYHVLFAKEDITSLTIIDGLTITAGNANGSASASKGGGLHCHSASPTLLNCIFKNNQADEGGGVFAMNSTPLFSHCKFHLNKSALHGGAILNDGSSPNFISCAFRGNEALTNGGALANQNASSPTLINCILQGNKALTEGGALYNRDGSPSLTNCSIQGNFSSQGGGVSNNSSSPALTNCVIWNNQDMSGLGSAQSSILNDPNSTPTFSHCLVQGIFPSGQNNLNGSLETNAPLFNLPVDPTSAPTIDGDLQTRSSSPLIDRGDSDAIQEPADINGKPRKLEGTGHPFSDFRVDLGAHELRVHFVKRDSTFRYDGSTWRDAHFRLYRALDSATAGDEIWVTHATYTPFLPHNAPAPDRHTTFALKSGVRILGGFPAAGGTLAERNPIAHPSILSGDLKDNDQSDGDVSDNAYHVITALNVDSTTVLDGFLVTGGNADLDHSHPDNLGGGLHCRSSSPTIINCHFRGNRASYGGGGIANNNSSPTFIRCSVNGNLAKYGGGIYNYDFSSPSFTNCAVYGNRAERQGGGIYNYLRCETLLTNCTLQGNLAASGGGGIYCLSSSPTLSNCVIWDNQDLGNIAPASDSLFNDEWSNPTYSHCLIQGLHPPGLNNLDGTNGSSDPLFAYSIAPVNSPFTEGDLRLLFDSPALDVGDDTIPALLLDLAGSARRVGAIDLGAFEGAFTTFTHSGYTNPDGDDNANGISNFIEYAAGYNPTGLNTPTQHPQINGRQLTFSHRLDAIDAVPVFQASHNLRDWFELIEGIDYHINNLTVTDNRRTLTLDLLRDDSELYFRGKFTSH